jgi:hypothetical protein
MSAKFTTEICINNASSYSRLTAAGRQSTAADSHSQTWLQTLFFSLSLPLMRKQLNYTCMLKNLLKRYCISTWDNLWICLFFLFFFSYVTPLMRQLQNNIWGTISRIGGWGTKPKLLKLKLHCIWTSRFFFLFYYFLLYISFYFIFYTYIYFFFHLFILYSYSIFILFIFYFQSSLCLSNAFSACCWLEHCLSLFISLKPFLFVSLFCFFFIFFYLIICFSLYH